MRAAVLSFVVLASAPGCGGGASTAAPIPPVPPGDTQGLDPAVVELVEKHLALVRAAPSHARAHGTLALVYEANELWGPAAAEYASAATLDPKEPLWRYHRSIALRKAGDVAGADRLLREAAAGLPDDPGVQHRLGQSFLDAGELELAERAFQRALARAPEQPECLVGLAFVALARDDFAAARDFASRAIHGDPAYPQAHYAVGLAYRGLGDTQSASIALARGTDAKTRFLDDPLSAELRTYQVNTMSRVAEANQLLEARRVEEALALWAKIAADRPRDEVLQTNYGSVLLGAGRVDEAIEVLTRSLAIDEGEFGTHLNLAEAFLARQELGPALEHADRAVALAPQVSRTHRTRAHVLAGRKTYDEAYLELEETVRLDPKDAEALSALGELAVLLGRPEVGREWCRAALAVDPSLLPPRVNLAVLTLRSGDVEAARVQVKELVRLAPDHPRVKSLAAELGVRR